jgi:hypothetical protein
MERGFLGPGLSLYGGAGTSHMVLVNRWQDNSIPLADEVAAALRRAATDGLAADDPLLEPLLRSSLVHMAATPADPFLACRIEDLDRPFEWCLDPKWMPLRNIVLEAHSWRRILHIDCWQLPALPETVARRAMAVHRGGPDDVLLIGDDDLLSLPLAKLGHRVWVVDIDRDLIDLIVRSAAHFGLRIGVVEHDLRRGGLKEALANAGAPAAFGAVVTDPVYSTRGLEVFAACAFDCTLPHGNIYVAFGGYSREVMHEQLKKWDLLPDDVQRDCAHYYCPYSLRLDVITSDLWRIPRLDGRTLGGDERDDAQWLESSYKMDLELSTRTDRPHAALPASIALVRTLWPKLPPPEQVLAGRGAEEALLALGSAVIRLTASGCMMLLRAVGVDDCPELADHFRGLPGVGRVQVVRFPRGPGAENECFLRQFFWPFTAARFDFNGIPPDRERSHHVTDS